MAVEHACLKISECEEEMGKVNTFIGEMEENKKEHEKSLD